MGFDQALYKPFVIIDGESAWGVVGRPVRFDAGGSYSVNGSIIKYEWDSDGDRQTDVVTRESVVEHVFERPFEGYVGVKATDSRQQTSIASIRLTIEQDGDKIPDKHDNCPAVDNIDQADYNDDGVGDACDPEIPTDPEQLQEWLKRATMINRARREIRDLMDTGMTMKQAVEAYKQKHGLVDSEASPAKQDDRPTKLATKNSNNQKNPPNNSKIIQNPSVPSKNSSAPSEAQAVSDKKPSSESHMTSNSSVPKTVNKVDGLDKTTLFKLKEFDWRIGVAIGSVVAVIMIVGIRQLLKS